MNPLIKKACLLTSCTILVLTASILVLFLRHHIGQNPDTGYTAYIYQDGQLLQTIPLSQVTESYDITIKASNGGYNLIQISHGAIAITEADCPDQICVHQGTITDSLLPITCLPHRLVIELKSDSSASFDNTPDAVAY